MSEFVESLSGTQQSWLAFGIFAVAVFIMFFSIAIICNISARGFLIGIIGITCYLVCVAVIGYNIMNGERDGLIESGDTYTLDGKQYKVGESNNLVEIEEGKTYTLDGKQYKVGENNTLIEVKEDE